MTKSFPNLCRNVAIACSVMAAALCLSPAQAAPESITFVSWGGTTQDAQNQAWAKSFTKNTGIKVINGGPTNYGKFKAMVKSGHVTWDVVDVEGPFAYRAAKEGLLEPLDFTVINKSDVDERFVTDYAVGDFYFSFVLSYNKNRINEPVDSWKALFDTKTYPGKRTLYGYPSPGVLEMALLASGVKADNLYPLDLDRAFKQLDKIKNDIKWWKTGAQSQQYLASGSASMGSLWNGRVYYLHKEGIPVATVWKNNIATADFLVVPKGAPHKKAAMKFIAHAVSAKPQAKFAELTAYTPVNPNAIKQLPAELKKYLSSSHTDHQVTLNIQYWADHLEEISKAWHKWLLE